MAKWFGVGINAVFLGAFFVMLAVYVAYLPGASEEFSPMPLPVLAFLVIPFVLPFAPGAWPQRVRKALGLVVLLAFIVVYIVFAVQVSAVFPSSRMAEMLYYLFAGFAWVFPLRPLVIWMQTPNPGAVES